MKKIIAALVLMLASMSTFAATEIWMMHSPDCPYCRNFLRDHHFVGNSGEHILIYRNEVREQVEVTLVVVNIYADTSNTPKRVLDAFASGKMEMIQWTPWFYRWDTETKAVTSVWKRGWNKRMEADFREWVLGSQ